MRPSGRVGDGGTYCGRLEATVHGRWAEIAFLFGPAFWGHGLATEAVSWLRDELRARFGVTELWAAVRPENERSLRLLDRLGFVERAPAAAAAAERALCSADAGDRLLRWTANEGVVLGGWDEAVAPTRSPAGAECYKAAMTTVDAGWEARITELWAALDRHAPDELVARIDALAAELPSGHPVGLFERASARDSTGHSDRAVPLYRAALAGGLDGPRRRRAVIQLASSLRSIGEVAESLRLLQAELEQPSDELDGAVRGFLALALVDAGREREAVAASLTALAKYLPRYNRSLARYAARLVDNS